MLHEPKFWVTVLFCVDLVGAGVAMRWPNSRALGAVMMVSGILGLAAIFFFWPESDLVSTAATPSIDAKDNRGGVITQGQTGGTNIGTQNNYTNPSFEPPTFTAQRTGRVTIDIGTVGLAHSLSEFGVCIPDAEVENIRANDPQYFERIWQAMTSITPAIVDGVAIPLGFCRSDNRLLISTALLAGTGEPPVKVFQNRFSVRPPDWDFNQDESAFEAVDEHQRPRLQLMYRTSEEIYIRGIFVGPNGDVAAMTDQGMVFNPSNGAHITPLFKYPSVRYPKVHNYERDKGGKTNSN